MARLTQQDNLGGLVLIGLGTAIFVATGCKPSAASRPQSLDNFAATAGAFTFNSCSGSNTVAVADDRIEGSATERTAVRSALSALPVQLQNAFFDELKGKILLQADISTACKNVPVEDKESLLSCWVPESSSVSILIKREADESQTIRNIKHATVRAMGFILTEVILKIKAGAGVTQLSESSGAFDDVSREIARAVLADIKTSKKYQVPASLSPDSVEFQKAAFAESFDSWYCSAQSRHVMAKDFQKAHDLFQELANVIPEALTARPDSFVTGQNEGQQTSDTRSGFGLWGRWGWGNGPVRQAFSNWAGFRAQGGGLFNFNRAANGGGFIFQRPWFNPWRWGS